MPVIALGESANAFFQAASRGRRVPHVVLGDSDSEALG
jgi:hypothetical protein